MVAKIGANQVGGKETLAGGARSAGETQGEDTQFT